jgi:hypothetical protein
MSIAPNPWEDASHSTVKGLVKLGMARTSADVMAAVSAENAAVAASF